MLSDFISDDNKLKAIVYAEDNGTEFYVDFYKDGNYILSESYTDKNLYYHENAAENYVMGIKKL
jgi:hypothetical protein